MLIEITRYMCREISSDPYFRSQGITNNEMTLSIRTLASMRPFQPIHKREYLIASRKMVDSTNYIRFKIEPIDDTMEKTEKKS